MSRMGDFIRLGIDPRFSTRFVKVKLTAAQILTLRAAPKTLVPAQGTNRLIQIVGGGVVELNPGTVAFTEGGVNLVVRYTNGSGVVVSDVIEMTGFITQTTRYLTPIMPVKDAIVAASAGLNKALVLHNSGGAEFGGAGTGTMNIWLAYRVWDFTP